MLRNLKQTLARNISNILGWRTDRKIVVIESDDWGSIRMPSRKVWQQCYDLGFAVDSRPFERFDSLETADDLSSLFEVLASFRDNKENHPVITANAVTANPNFELIKRCNFESYHYETIEDTYRNNDHSTSTFDLLKEGITKGLMYPQFHGREHYNVYRWLDQLRNNDKEILLLFDLGLVGLAPRSNPAYGNQLLKALECSTKEELNWQVESLIDGARLFENLFGNKSKTFIAPCYTWSTEVELPLKELGVMMFQGNRVQFDPYHNRSIRRIMGERNEIGQYYSVRNALFEPSLSLNSDVVSDCLKDISNAFFWGKPAIISTHRINFVGSIDVKNRDRNLVLLRLLLKEIQKRWKDVEFLNSCNLLDIMIE